jgi:hypothetical protein
MGFLDLQTSGIGALTLTLRLAIGKAASSHDEV